MTMVKVVATYRIGPKKVTTVGGWPAIYLPKELSFLKGQKVLLTIEVLGREN